jgi:hypothetical protein
MNVQSPLVMTSIGELIAADLGIIQNRESEDYQYADKLAEIYPAHASLLPQPLADKYVEIIHASLTAPGSHLVGTYILADLIPQQLGFVNGQHEFLRPSQIPRARQPFYFELAQLLATQCPEWDADILRNLPEIIDNHGAKETRRIIHVAMQLQDKDFGDEHNMVLFYTGIKAGHRFCGMDEEDHRVLESRVENKYSGRPLKKKHVYDTETVNAFCKKVRSMNNPRERRAFIDSFYVNIRRYSGQLENMSAEGIEAFADLCKQFGFEHHADKILDSRHYKFVRSYDAKIAVHPIESGPVTALYQTADTRKLDALFDLTGEPIEDSRSLTPHFGFGRTEQEILLPRFARVAGKTGNFFGLRLEEAVNMFNLSEHYFTDSVREGYLERFEHDGAVVVSPTAKYAR